MLHFSQRIKTALFSVICLVLQRDAVVRYSMYNVVAWAKQQQELPPVSNQGSASINNLVSISVLSMCVANRHGSWAESHTQEREQQTTEGTHTGEKR